MSLSFVSCVCLLFYTIMCYAFIVCCWLFYVVVCVFLMFCDAFSLRLLSFICVYVRCALFYLLRLKLCFLMLMLRFLYMICCVSFCLNTICLLLFVKRVFLIYIYIYMRLICWWFLVFAYALLFVIYICYIYLIVVSDARLLFWNNNCLIAVFVFF